MTSPYGSVPDWAIDLDHAHSDRCGQLGRLGLTDGARGLPIRVLATV